MSFSRSDIGFDLRPVVAESARQRKRVGLAFWCPDRIREKVTLADFKARRRKPVETAC